MAGRRQHYIPQMLLRRFADTNGAVMVIRTDGSRFSAKTKNVALETDFHGTPGDGTTDEAITREETKIWKVLCKLVECPEGTVDCVDAATVLSHFYTRSAAWRSQTATMVDTVVGVIRAKLDASDQARDPSFQLITSLAFSRLEKLVPTRIVDAHNALLKKEPTPAQRATSYSKFRYVVQDFDVALVLGDSIAWGASVGTRGIPLVEHDDSVEYVVFPLSVKRCLIGSRGSQPLLEADDIIAGSFAASSEFVVVHPQSSGYDELVPTMGSGMRELSERLRRKVT
ncbi:DUF4238 domain-containing protein [Ottowia pentelensis]